MTEAKLEDVTSVDEFRRLYYPEPEPVPDYFDGSGPPNGVEEDDAGVVSQDPLDLFSTILRGRR